MGGRPKIKRRRQCKLILLAVKRNMEYPGPGRSKCLSPRHRRIDDALNRDFNKRVP
jgi:hypothetical protein